MTTEDYQYRFENISIPKASPSEPILEKFSLERALNYLEQSAAAWNGSKRCVSCHTNGAYMTIRPALSRKVGDPPKEQREFLQTTLKNQLGKDRKNLFRGLVSAQVIHVAAGLAEWDAHVTKSLSVETRQALSLMFEIQSKDGAWARPGSCWPPFESDSYHGATLAAMAVTTAPGWLAGPDGQEQRTAVERLKHYLRTEVPPHDYARLWLLRASARMPDLLPKAEKGKMIKMIWAHQRPDGGWSIRSFAKPEEWGDGNRAERLKAEPEFENLPSDGHQTGLAIIALREAGVPASDPRIRKGLQWLLTHQRVSGRWWTRSLNTDKWHFITFSGACYALFALSLCDALPNEYENSTHMQVELRRGWSS